MQKGPTALSPLPLPLEERSVAPVKLVQMNYGSALDIIPIRPEPESNLKCVYRANDFVRQVGSLPIVIMPRLSRVSRPDDRDIARQDIPVAI